MFKQFSPSLFRSNLARAGVQKQVEAAQIIREATQLLPQLLGDVVAGYCEPIHIKNGTLTIVVNHPAVGEKILDASPQIIRTINSQHEAAVVQRIQLSLPVQKSPLLG